MKVTLIVPPSGFQLDERVYPMLGVLKVAAVLERAGIMTDVLDLSGAKSLGIKIYQHWYANGNSDFYGITATLPQMPAAREIAQEIRHVVPNARIILGGAHPTMVNAAARNGVERSAHMLQQLLTLFDVVVAGDGEKAIFGALSGVTGLIDADRPETDLFLKTTELSNLPWPARHLIDLPTYHCSVDDVPATSMIAQLGCPFRCGFCGGRNSPTFRRVRLRESSDVVAELKHVYREYGYEAFMFLDDELNVSKSFPQLLRDIIQAQRDLNVEWRLCGLLKSELFSQEQATLMFEAGFRKILIGFESGHPRILANMQKNATVEHNTRAIELAHGAGLRIKALMSLGHPGESLETIDETERWLLDTRPDEFDATVLTIYPGTPYHDEATRYDGAWKYTAKGGDTLYFHGIDQLVDTPYYKGVPGAYRSYVWTDYLTPTELVSARDALERRVRERLEIPWPVSAAERQYEHSMGLS